MYTLNVKDLCLISGGETSRTRQSNYDEFWQSFFQGAGWGSGALVSIPIALGITVYAIGYYGVYTPCYYAVTGTYSAVAYCGNAIYNGGAMLVGAK